MEGFDNYMKKYSLGIDFGTLSGRAALIDLETGEEAASDVLEYGHGVMSEILCDGKTMLPPKTALQNPQDYIDVLKTTIPNVIKKSGVKPTDIIGVGVDFTACTLIPTDKCGKPLYFYEKYKSRPHAYAKLWKHHSAQKMADRFNELANKRKEKFLKYYGGKISSEWLFPKVMQILEEDEEIYNAADKFIEAGDWIVQLLTGQEKRSICQAGYKAAWNEDMGYPSKAFLKELNPGLENVAAEKLSCALRKPTECVGTITKDAAKLTGLCEGTAVSAAIIDAHAALPAAGITTPGKLLMIMGTSTCHIILSDKESFVKGVAGVVKDGIIPGYYAYEAGQACVGDHFEWFVKNAVPYSYYIEAENTGENIYSLLERKAKTLKPGESGLVALDWFNGSRILSDSDLSGVVLGYTLQTKPEEIYRALIEATAFGTRMIIETFEQGGIDVNELIAAGGLPQKNDMLMQIYADVTNRPIRIVKSTQSCAAGAAIFGAVAAGEKNGGFGDIAAASERISGFLEKVYKPNEENVKLYDKIYNEYKDLHKYFSEENEIMKKIGRKKK